MNFAHFGPAGLIMILFLVVGAGMWINIIWGLLTGGPRARTEAGNPYLYSRLYYLQFLFAMTGWTLAIVSFPITETADTGGTAFIFGWGICAMGIGSIFFWRLPMLLRGSKYLAVHGWPPFRWYHQMQILQLDRMESQFALVFKIVPVAFMIIGLVVTLVTLAKFPLVMAEVEAGLATLRQFLIS